MRVSASGAGVVSPVGTLYLTTLPTQIVLTATADVGAALRYFSINDADQKYAGESFVLHVRDADFYEVKAHFLTARYVAPDGSDANSGETLENPWRTLQYAVDTVPVGGMVLAAPGVYDEGSSVKASHNNRVAITRDVVLKSLEGAAVTYIVGATDPNGNQFGCGPNAMRCVYMNNGAVQGFTLTGGASSVSEGDADQAQVRGGGVYGGNTYEVTDCVISNNVASRGAASFFATVKRCLITRNRATNNGVLRDAKIYDSLIVDNTGSALRFGGNFVYNCTISGNSGGGVLDAVVAYNSIIYNNGSTDVHTTGVCTNCLTGDVLRPGAGNIIGEPLFVDAPNGDYRLLALSPCVDTGALEYVVPRYREDFAGAPRVSGDSVNMGAYEGAVGAITASSTVGGQIEPVGDFLLNSNMTFKATALPGRLLRYFEINGVPVEGGGATLTINAQEYDGEAVIVRAVFQDGYYVDVQNGDDDNGGLEADEPLKSLQLAVDRALDGDTVRVAPGVYDSGSTIVEAGMLACRLAITKDITVEATGGAANTLIVGAASFGVDHFGSDAVRGVYMTSGRLNGFTICGGFTDSVDGGFENDCGGGIYVQTASVEMAIVDCVISNNTAYRKGGGGSNGRYHRCLITGNSIVAGAPSAFGAGIRNGLLYDCVVAFNNGSSGIAHATLRNVTYYDHSPILNCEVANSIVQCIGGGDGMVAGDSTFKVYCSCVSGSLASGNNGSGNIFERPLMLDPQSGDFRLHSTSPCIDSGSVVRYESGFWQDFSGGTRLAGAQIDMGALEGGIGGVLAIPGVEGGGVIEPAVSLYTNQLPATLTFTAQPFDGREFLYFVTNGVALPYAGNTLQLTFDDDIMIDLQAVFAGTLYADANQPDDSGDGITWQSAKRTLQAAVDAAYDHDTIVVAPGVYEEGDAVTPTVGGYLKNRVVILKNITLRSRDGAQVTTIRGALDPNTDDSYGRGPDAMRCVYMRQGVLEGFTLTGGATDRVNLEDENNRGGGFYADHFNYDPLVRECRLVANASMRGGGSHAGTLERCLFDGNYAEINSAAMRGGEAHNCLMINSSGASAAVGWAGIYNCTVADNQPTGVTETRIYNCVISGNSQYGQCFNSCLTTEIKNPVAAENNIVANPLFVNAASGDYRLQSGSPAIDIGASSYVRELFGIDHSGGMRMQNGAVDAGAFEYDWHPQFAQALDAEGVVVDEITPFVMYDEDVGYVNGSALLLNGWAARTNGQSVVTVTIPWQVPFGRSVRLGYEVTGSGTLELYEGETLLETVVLADGRVEKKITTTQQRPFPLRAVYTVGVEDTGGALLDGFEGFGGLLLLLR